MRAFGLLVETGCFYVCVPLWVEREKPIVYNIAADVEEWGSGRRYLCLGLEDAA